ncbi:hypothetical protein BAUCODRAFT_79454 [Baudoinia panamericana UAMH 10762]|uniref:NmrA-like domain-containing protein n=1 Tax=Baudoinia panamericana (strain UAMH 10762) TaxID=717646 RepID=M2MZC7_BAUPA|nr:uncharacterized protein BAUCODRAFT_79454 [Baudoinia panamericana UAMH 10762]EMC92014.1 hypothetical protein BAUCODRAFT_79454 [Baudoinia panamericana UAMH 10762]
MPKQRVLLVGAAGETGKHILEGLLEDGAFEVTCFVRKASQDKPGTKSLQDRRVKVVLGDLDGPISDVIELLQDIDIVISCLTPAALRSQLPLIDAAVKARVQRFVPCHWGTPSARGIAALKDLKEDIDDSMFRQRLGFTIIDVGFWYQASIPRVPSGRFDDAIFLPANEIYAGGRTPNMLIDVRDVGRITAKIVGDARTLNKRVIAYGAVLSQNEIQTIIEEKSGEKLELTTISDEEALATLNARKKALEAIPHDKSSRLLLAAAQYAITKYVRGDNTPENAEYLGYVNARDLFPDFRYTSFAEFVNDLTAGKIRKPYSHVQM